MDNSVGLQINQFGPDWNILTFALINIKSGWKMTPFAAKLISNKSCFCHDIFFATGTRVPQKNEKSVAFFVLSVLIGWSKLRFLVT